MSLSLKALHIVFIAASTLLVVGLGVWQLVKFFSVGTTGALIWGLCGLGAGVLLVVYGITFLKKLKGVSML